MRRILVWLLAQLALAALLTGLGLSAAGLWIYLREPAGFAVRHREEVERLKAEQLNFKAALIDVEGRMMETRTQVSAQQLRATQAAKVAHDLEELSGGLNWLTTNSEQLKENEQRRVRMRQMETASRQRVVDLGQALTRLQWEKDGLEIALQRSQEKLTTVAAENSPWQHYAVAAWNSAGKWVLLAVGLIMLGLPVWRLARGR